MSTYSIADACTQRVATAEQTDLTALVEAVRHPLNGATREQLLEVIATLAAQNVRLDSGIDRRAALAVRQIGSIVADWQRPVTG